MSQANQRLAMVTRYCELLASGTSPADAAAQVGKSRTTLDRWKQGLDADGFEALVPKHANSGRKSEREKLEEKLGKERVQELLDKAAATALDTKSAIMGLRLVARSADAPEEFAQVIDYASHGGPRSSKHAIPPSLRAPLRLDRNQALRHHGPRAANLRGMWTPRRVDILPGDIWTSDDTTPIWAWWVPWPHAKDNAAFPKDSCEFRFGVKLLQGQLLPLMDVASQCIFTFALIARETSSYRAADIWSLFGRAFAKHGLPRLGFQLERGSWEANLIRGVAVDVQDGEVSWARRVGGLRMLPTNVTDWHRQQLGEDFAFPKSLHIWTSFLPKTKSIEAALDRMQTLEGTIWGNLGRDQMRRPNERAKRQYESCRRGAADPREYFLSGTEMCQRVQAIIDFLNDEPMEGQVFRGIPRLLFEQGLRDNRLLRLPSEQQFLFRRNWHVTRITNGWVTARFQDANGHRRLEYFTNPEAFAQVGMEGKRVIMYFDAEQIEEPAQIIDAASDEYLCTADHFCRPGMFLDTDHHGHDIRKRYNQAVTTIYGDMVKLAPSRQMPVEVIARRESARQPVQESAAAGSDPQTVVQFPERPRGRVKLAATEGELAAMGNKLTKILAATAAAGNGEEEP